MCSPSAHCRLLAMLSPDSQPTACSLRQLVQPPAFETQALTPESLKVRARSCSGKPDVRTDRRLQAAEVGGTCFCLWVSWRSVGWSRRLARARNPRGCRRHRQCVQGGGWWEGWLVSLAAGPVARLFEPLLVVKIHVVSVSLFRKSLK